MDRYTKLILTVIALALTAIAVEHATSRAFAMGDDQCGSYGEPCYVRLADSHVIVKNYQCMQPPTTIAMVDSCAKD